MDILIKGVRIIDPLSPLHLQEADIFIQQGVIVEMGTINRPADQVIHQPGIHASCGWTDIFANFCDPGYEQKETLVSGAKAAAAGGFTDVLLVPDTVPAADKKTAISYLVQSAATGLVGLHPIGAITKNREGKELAEMYDMADRGAVAFSDGHHPVQQAGILLKALQYVKAINKVVIQVPDDHTIGSGGLMHEGIPSTRLGLPGKPAIAESLMVSRDIELVKYTGSKLHLTGISTAGSVALVRAAKAAGLPVTASVTPYHLTFCDEDLEGYNTNFKVAPPLRGRSDRAALQEAVLDGTINCIASHHQPQHLDDKVVEFEYAQYGMAGIESSFAAVRSALPTLPIEKLIQLFTAGRTLFGLPAASIQTGRDACITLFQPDQKFMAGNHFSKSRNNAFAGRELTGKPTGVINNGKLFLQP